MLILLYTSWKSCTNDNIGAEACMLLHELEVHDEEGKALK